MGCCNLRIGLPGNIIPDDWAVPSSATNTVDHVLNIDASVRCVLFESKILLRGDETEARTDTGGLPSGIPKQGAVASVILCIAQFPGQNSPKTSFSPATLPELALEAVGDLVSAVEVRVALQFVEMYVAFLDFDALSALRVLNFALQISLAVRDGDNASVVVQLVSAVVGSDALHLGDLLLQALVVLRDRVPGEPLVLGDDARARDLTHEIGALERADVLLLLLGLR